MLRSTIEGTKLLSRLRDLNPAELVAAVRALEDAGLIGDDPPTPMDSSPSD